jgi:hypothetical protein
METGGEMTDEELTARYNYDEFIPTKFEPWLNFEASPPLGTPAPDFPLWHLDGTPTRLSQVWSANAYTMVEFGSFTWPYCGMAASSMEAIAQKFSPRGIGAVFLYTHEARPGEFYPHLTSMEQKFRHARDLREKLGVRRAILVDSLEGACHRAYGSMPNMTWIFNASGVPVYKSDWTDARSIENGVEYLTDVRERRDRRERLAPFRVERLDYRTQDLEAFYRGLDRNGPKAVREFRAAFG